MAKQAELENKYIAMVADNDKKYAKLGKSNPAASSQALTAFSLAQAKLTFTSWKTLYADLFVKYMDGNIKTPLPGKRDPDVKQPGYSQDWYRVVVKETGDKLKVPGPVSH